MSDEDFTIGVDLGSRKSKAVRLESESFAIAGSAVVDTGSSPAAAYAELEARLGAPGPGSRCIGRVLTGYGRGVVPDVDRVTEITCHAEGVRHLFPDVSTIIEIGGQDSKVIRIGANGSVVDFAMNDRCAAGTGRFLEMVARVFDCALGELDELASRAEGRHNISSTCVVFAESEIISALASGAARENVAAGVYFSIARKIAPLVERVGVGPPIVFTGGVALSSYMRIALQKVLDAPVTSCSAPLITGALGAALIAGKQVG